ncbi:MAG: hypothetical protein CFE45_31005, partial [Burkholderiales bacterium PBB5]
MGVFVSNHDKFAGRRLWDQVGGDLARYKLTAATYLMLPGTPYIYYGEEIGQSGAEGLVDDPQIRGPMSWTADTTTAGFTTGKPYRALAANRATHNAAVQAVQANGLFAHYQALIQLRNTLPSIARGSYEQAVASGSTLSFQRRLGTEHTLLTYNYGTVPATLAVAAGCSFRLSELRYEYPDEIVPAGHTPTSWLATLTAQGALRRFAQGVPASVQARLDHELALIRQLAFEPYFLTVADIVHWARGQGILCQGRGSAANSVVCFCLGITEVNPTL